MALGSKRLDTPGLGGGETEIDFVLVKKESRKFLKDVKVIPWELQHRVVQCFSNHGSRRLVPHVKEKFCARKI